MEKQTYTVGDLAKRVGGQVVGHDTVVLTGIAPAQGAGAGDLTFAETESFFAVAEASGAAAVLVSESCGVVSETKTLIRVANARVALVKLLPLFSKEPTRQPGVHETAVIDRTAQVDPSAHVGPYCVVEAGVKIEAGAILVAGNHVGEASVVGEGTILYPQVVLYPRTRVGKRVRIHAGTTVGSDGFGYVMDQGKHVKMEHLGNVVIQDDVEIGSNASIDRGALGSTMIGAGTKIDNLVHVAHNVVMGRHCLIMGQSGFAGSTQLGDYCVVASQSGIAGHLKLGNQSTVGAKSGVMRDVPDKGVVLGIPAMPDKQTKRAWIGLHQLPETTRRLRDLERQVKELRELISPDQCREGAVQEKMSGADMS